jgi:hypothetical protein
LTFKFSINIILPVMTGRIENATTVDGRTATTAAVTPGRSERKRLPEGNVAIVRRHTDNAHRIYFSVEIGKILEHPYTRGSTPGETEARVDILEITHMARSTGEITDEFVVGRKGNSPILVGIKPIDPEKRVLMVEAPKDANGRLGDVTLIVPGNKPVEIVPSVLEALGDIKEGMVFGPVASQFFYDVLQGQFPPRLASSITE